MTILLMLCMASKSTNHVFSFDPYDSAHKSPFAESSSRRPSTAYCEDVFSIVCHVGLLNARFSFKKYMQCFVFNFFFYSIVKVSIVSRFFDGAICAPRQPRYNQFIEWGLFVDKMTNLKEKIQRILLKKKT